MERASPLGPMSVEEKLRALERIRENLCRDASAVPSPRWHRDALEAREARVRAGPEETLDWDEAQRRIRESRA